MVEAWYMDIQDSENPRAAHRFNPNRPVSLDHLAKLGVLYWHIEGNTLDELKNSPELARIRDERGYNYSDIVTISPDKLPNYEEKIRNFFEEHLHTDEEIRFILDGSGYFDVRDLDDSWIRIQLNQGDMIVLPKGIYHRFTVDDSNFALAMRLFQGEPIWTPHNRALSGTDQMEARKTYCDNFVTV